MPVNFLSEAERLRFTSFPDNLSADDLIGFFTLSQTDIQQIPAHASAVNRLGFALQLLLLRFLGFHPPQLTSVPEIVIEFVASQIDVESVQINFYGIRDQTRSDHQRQIENYLGYRSATQDDLKIVTKWLNARALEHDRPMLLMQMLL